MVEIIYRTADEEYQVDAEEGINLIQLAVGNGVPCIKAECGGAMACATCHVHVDSAWYERLPKPADAEVQMLEFADIPVRPADCLVRLK
jgi:2Fe-2S ferredoxin